MATKESENVREWRHFLKGIVVGVIGNFLVSTSIGMVESSGVNKIMYTVLLGISVLLLDSIIKTEGEELGISEKIIRRVRLGFWSYLIFLIVWFILTFFVFKLF